jgi:hypothetical protein
MKDCPIYRVKIYGPLPDFQSYLCPTKTLAAGEPNQADLAKHTGGQGGRDKPFRSPGPERYGGCRER